MAKRNWPRILYEDSELIAIDKPAGLLCVAADTERSATAWRQVTDYLQIRNRRARAFVVHRLDRDTSGVLLFAKNERLKLALQERWNELVCCRGYLAITVGRPVEDEGVVRSFLLENRAHMVYSAPQSRGGKEAVTRYQVLESRKGYSLLAVELDTGRKNQIRVHLSEMGCPVAGDKKYGGGAGGNPLGRLGLHARRLALLHPGTGRELSFEAAIPMEFERMFPGNTSKEVHS